MKPVYRTRTVALQIPAGAVAGTFIPFPDQQDLKKGAIVTGFETFTEADLLVTPAGTVLSNADSQNVVLTLAEGSDERVRLIPYLACRVANNAGQVREVVDLTVEWTQSGVTLYNTVATASVALVAVHYFYPSDRVRGK